MVDKNSLTYIKGAGDMGHTDRKHGRKLVAELSVLQAATLFLWVVPTLAGKTIPTRLDFEDGRKILGERKSLSSHLMMLFVKRILDRERLRHEKRESYGYSFGEATRVRISGWPDIYDVRKPIPEDLKAALEKVTTSFPQRRAKHIV